MVEGERKEVEEAIQDTVLFYSTFKDLLTASKLLWSSVDRVFLAVMVTAQLT